jgi:fatty acid desaturase
VWTALYLCTIFFSFVGAVAVHNMIHCPVFHSKLANKLLQITLSLVYGHPVCNYVPGHNLSHHQNTQTARDVMRTQKMRYKWHLLNGLLFGPVIGLAMLGNDVVYFSEQRKLGRPIFKQMKLEQVINFTCAAVLIILSPHKWVVCTMIPHLIAKFGIISLNILQHDGCDEHSPYNHSRNFVGRVLNFFCYNNGYHGIHHLHPGWHWSILPQKHKELVKPYLHPNLDQASILGYTFRTFVYPGKRIDYLGNPLVLPPVQADEPWFYQTNETFSSDDKME